MNQVQYTCGNCGKPTSRSDSRCPHCGVSFGGIHCKNCGYNGAASEFKNDICPKCGRNAYTGRKAPEGPKELTPQDSARAAGCMVVLAVVLIASGLLFGLGSGCRGVLVVMGALCLIAVIPFALGAMDTKKKPALQEMIKPEPSKKPAPVPQTSSFAPCPFPQFPLTGWKDPITGGFFVPHPMSWNAGVRSAYEGLTRFIMSGEMFGRFFYAHFSREGTVWKAMIDDYLP
jgi:DNA-directed RNA polymerase subunit RPC12/RpoP